MAMVSIYHTQKAQNAILDQDMLFKMAAQASHLQIRMAGC